MGETLALRDRRPTPQLLNGKRARRGRSRFVWLAVVAVAATLGRGSAAAAQIWEDYDFRELEFQGIGLEGGRVWAGRTEPGTLVVLRLDLGFIAPGTRIMPNARFWSTRLAPQEVERLASQIVLVCERQGDVTCPERLDLGEVRLSDLELTVDAHYLFLPRRRLSPFAGATLGLHLLNGSGESIDATFVEDLLDTVAPGVGPIIGANVRVGPALQLHGEVRFILASDVRYASLSGGGTWTLPAPVGN